MNNQLPRASNFFKFPVGKNLWIDAQSNMEAQLLKWIFATAQVVELLLGTPLSQLCLNVVLVYLSNVDKEDNEKITFVITLHQ